MKMLLHNVVLTAAFSCAPLVSGFEVPVIVREPAGIERRAEPISGGIPLPPRMFRPGTVRLALFDGEEPVPLQVNEFVVGPEGFVRWVLLDFQLALKANEKRTLVLKTGRPAAPALSLIVNDSSESVQIDTGRIAFTVSKDKPFGLVENVTANRNRVVETGRVSYVNGFDDIEYEADQPKLVRVHYSGPLRVTVEVRGRFKDDQTAQLAYCAYITAWAGRSDILVKHSLINSREDQRYLVKIKSSRIELMPTSSAQTIRVGADKPLSIAAGEQTSLHQGLTEMRSGKLASAKVAQGDRQIWGGRGAGGWISSGPVWVADRLFRSDPPRLLAVLSDGRVVLDAAPRLCEGRRRNGNIQGRPWACQDDYRWLYDCSHHSSECRIDFDAPDDGEILAKKAHAAAARVWAFAPGRWYSECGVLGVGKFGTLADEVACHTKWGWIAGRKPERQPNPRSFIGYEDNHYESEADSAEGLLLMFLRTGQRGFFDEAEAWVRYHTDLQAWRTEGWLWKDGGIWWPQGGPPGNRPVRGKANLDFARWNKGSDADRTLWRTAMAKGCYCHFYGAGLVDWYCLTGDIEALQAAIDNCETKLDEFTHYRKFIPGESGLGSTRGFGRGFYVAVRTWMVQPKNSTLEKLVGLCRDTFRSLPDEYLDERGVYAVVQNKYPERYLTDGIKKFMAENQITVSKDGTFRDNAANSWKWKDIGGTWMISYIQSACNLLAEQTGDEDMMDYAIACGHFTSRFMLSPVAKQTWYYTALDVPCKGDIWDEWKYDGQSRNEFGEGPKTSGWYTRFFPDCCARAYSWTGEQSLLEKAKEFWSYGNRRRYQSRKLTATHQFANHVPPKDDSVLSTARLFCEYAHPRDDTRPPTAIKDLKVRRIGDGKAAVRFTAPIDEEGKVAEYQVKVSTMPIVPYEQWDYCRDSGSKRNWWKVINCKAEPVPRSPGQREDFTVTNVPQVGDKPLFFAVRSFDDSNNRSAISNVFKAE